jgi:hypothetical protein
MHRNHRSGLAAGAVGLGLLALALAPAAAHAGVPVNLRVEGPTRTVFEGRLTVSVHRFRFTGAKHAHECDGISQGTARQPVPTRGAALSLAAERFGFALKGSWSDQFGSPTFTRVGGQSVSYDATTQRYLAEFIDGKASQLGSCAERVHKGDDVLFAYSTGSDPLLALSGGARRLAPGKSTKVHVTAGGSPVAGATVGGTVSGADGTATVGPLSGGYHVLKASKPGTVRSNGVRVCVTAAGACAPLVQITDIRGGERFARSAAPRRLRGVVAAAPFGLKSIRLLLTRRGHGTQTLTVHRASDFSRGLLARLPRGHYVLKAVARDRRGNAGTDKVVFTVR